MGFNVLELFAKIGMDSSEFDKGLDSASSKLSSVGSKISKGAKVVAKAGAAAIGTATTALTKLTKDSVSSYAEYEQLVGGVKTLFGTGERTIEQYAESMNKSVDEVSADYARLVEAEEFMLDKANNAFATAGLSANQYMETSIGFSGALLKSLEGDTMKAAQLTDLAISDMADQANKYGKTVEDISITYTSLARGNTQTLDNLFGGMFAGTKAGLEEMLEYAEN